MMTPSTLAIDAANLFRQSQGVKTMDQLLQLRKEYMDWYFRLSDEISNSTDNSSELEGRFLKGDPVIADHLYEGGCGLDFNGARAQHVLRLIRQSLSDWIDSLLGKSNLEEAKVPKSNNVLELKRGKNLFTFDLATGDARLNAVTAKFKPGLQPFKLLCKLALALDYTETHEALCATFQFPETKAGRDKVYGIVKDIKEKLGILPKKSGRNRRLGLFISLHKTGYRLYLS